MPADLVLYHGNVWTMDPALPRATAVAIAGERILAVGQDAELRALLRPGGQACDLGGRTVVPGFTDSHLHLMSFGLSRQRLDLTGARTFADAVAAVAARAAVTPPGQWLRGRGWDDSCWADGGPLTREALDRAAPEQPVFLLRKCGHVAWVNSRALALAGVGPGTPDPPGGAIVREPETGAPTGMLKENALDRVAAQLHVPAPAEADAAIRTAMAAAHRAGLTGVHTMEGADTFAACQRLRAAGELQLRVQVNVPPADLARIGDAASRADDARLRLGGVKLFADGALGARTASLLEPYEGEPANRGIAVLAGDALRAAVRQAACAGLPVLVHAIGDRAARDVLDAIEANRRAGAGAALRHRLEHVQVLHPDDLPRLASLGVIASMQPLHATQDMLIAERWLGRRCAGAYAWRSLLETGAVLAFGSDAPVEDLSVLQGVHAAVTRRRADGSPGPDGWYPGQRLTVAEAVHAYTAAAAYASGEEAHKGTLTPGKLADLVVLSQDIFSIAPMAIRETAVVATVFAGKLVHGTL